jgi:hypothetical protein
MKNPYRLICFFSVFLFAQLKSGAQQVVVEKAVVKPNPWRVGLSYLSDNVYQGRKDSVALPYATASFGYYHKSGLFLVGAASFVLGYSENRLDLVNVEGGYNYSSDKVNFEISASKDFYSPQSFNVKSEIEGRLDAYFSYDLGFIEPNIQAGLNYAAQSDYGIGLGLEHSFSILEDKLEMSPSFLANLSTENFNASYYSKRRYSSDRRSKNKGNAASDVTAVLSNASKFQLMDYEFSVPTSYTVNNITLNFTPTYALPMNPSEVSTSQKQSNGNTIQQTTPEVLHNVFYWSLGLIYKF